MGDRVNNIVLVHGAWADGSGWRGVFDILRRDGFTVSVVQNPTVSLAGDAAAVRRVLDEQDGPVILAGHSYGGAVITEAGVHPKVAGLVYITAFVPDRGESVGALIANPPPDAPVPPVLPPQGGYVLLDRSRFAQAFAADVDAATAEFMASSQVPWGLDALSGPITDPAWKYKPSWYLLVTDDRMIPISAQRFMCQRAGATSSEVPGNHAIYVSNPAATARVIQTAARSVTLAASR